MSDTEEPEPEPKKKSLSDYITKKHVDSFLESLFIITVALVFFFFYPLIRYYAVEGVTLAKCYYDPPVGHGEPLGGHVAPEVTPVKKTRNWPTPTLFFDDYVTQSRPVLLQQAAIGFPAFSLWSDEHLRKRADTEDVKIRNSEGHFFYKPLSSFLDVYQQERLHLYTTVPKSLNGDLFMPLPIQCGNFPSALVDVSLWMNSGNITVGLNADILDGLHCSLRGNLSIVLISRVQHEIAKEGVTMSLDRRRLDLCMNRSLRKLSWFNVTLEEGDCLYIPSRWYKEATFHDDRNIGVSFRFMRLLFFNQSDCESKIDKSLPENQPEDELLKYELISLSENHATLDFFTFRRIFLMPDINDVESLTMLFTLLDDDGDGEVLPEDMYSMKTGLFLSFFKNYKTKDTERGLETVAETLGPKHPGSADL